MDGRTDALKNGGIVGRLVDLSGSFFSRNEATQEFLSVSLLIMHLFFDLLGELDNQLILLCNESVTIIVNNYFHSKIIK